MTSLQNSAWEQVLNQVEDDVRRTEAMLADATTPAADPPETAAAAHDAPHLAPAELMLPAASTGPELPPLSAMPPIPSELLDRIVALRSRINALRSEIESELLQFRSSRRPAEPAATQLRAAATVPSAPPRFVDRQL